LNIFKKLFGFNRKFKPKPPIFGPPNPTTFFDKLDELMKREIEKHPKDKQDHFMISKFLFHTVPVDAETPIGISLEAFVRVLKIGYEKEVNDVGKESKVNWDILLKEVAKLDKESAELKLDQKDLMADISGAGTSVVKHGIFELGSS